MATGPGADFAGSRSAGSFSAGLEGFTLSRRVGECATFCRSYDKKLHGVGGGRFQSWSPGCSALDARQAAFGKGLDLLEGRH